jgi:hypothetical protein
VRGAGGHCRTDGLTASTRATAVAASCIPAEMLMFIRVLKPLELQRSYKAKKSAAVETEALAVPAGRDVLRREPFRTTSAQEGEVDLIPAVN